MAIETDLLKALGGFDPIYNPGGFEDVDICYQARAIGRKVIYNGYVRFIHMVSHTFGTFNVLYVPLRNKYVFLRKHKPLLIPICAILDMMRNRRSS